MVIGLVEKEVVQIIVELDAAYREKPLFGQPLAHAVIMDVTVEHSRRLVEIANLPDFLQIL